MFHETCKHLLHRILEVDPRKRISIPEIYPHEWMKDADENIELFTLAEKETIKKEYCLRKRKGNNLYSQNKILIQLE